MEEGCTHLIISVDQAPVDLGDPNSNLNIKNIISNPVSVSSLC